MRIVKATLWMTCGLLLLAAVEARAGHIFAQEATTDTDTNVILNIPISLQKLPANVSAIRVLCVLLPQSHVSLVGVASLNKSIPVDGYTGAVSTTLTLRLRVREGNNPYTGPLGATCQITNLVVGGPTTAPGGQTAPVKQGATLEVTGSFP